MSSITVSISLQSHYNVLIRFNLVPNSISLAFIHSFPSTCSFPLVNLLFFAPVSPLPPPLSVICIFLSTRSLPQSHLACCPSASSRNVVLTHHFLPLFPSVSVFLQINFAVRPSIPQSRPPVLVFPISVSFGNDNVALRPLCHVRLLSHPVLSPFPYFWLY